MSNFDDFDDVDTEILLLLKRSLPPVSPRPDLFDEILEHVRPEAKVLPPRARRSRRRLLTVAVATGVSAGVAAVVLAAVVALSRGGSVPVDGRAAITGHSDPSVSGEAVLHGSTAAGGTVHIDLRGVPDAPAGRYYEIWIGPRGSARMEAIGALTPASADVTLDLPLPGPADYAQIDVSVERRGGPPARSNTTLASGRFR